MLPELPAASFAILASTMADINTSARQRLVNHFKRFNFDGTGEAWITYGVKHIHDNACPFCGRDEVDAVGNVTLYGQIFGETYKAHLAAITKCVAEVEYHLGEDSRTKIAGKVAANAESARKWAEFVQLERELPDVVDLGMHLAAAHTSAKALFDKKRSSPLDRIEDVEAIAAITAALASVKTLIDDYNSAVRSLMAPSLRRRRPRI